MLVGRTKPSCPLFSPFQGPSPRKYLTHLWLGTCQGTRWPRSCFTEASQPSPWLRHWSQNWPSDYAHSQANESLALAALNRTPSCLSKQAGSMEALAGADRQPRSQPMERIQVAWSQDHMVDVPPRAPPLLRWVGLSWPRGGGVTTHSSQSSPLKEVLHGFCFPDPQCFVIPTMVINTECPLKDLDIS